jgi:hypothetical protein
MKEMEMADDYIYSPKYVCERLGIAKSTLRRNRQHHHLGKLMETPVGPAWFYSQNDIAVLESIRGKPGRKPAKGNDNA